MTQLEQIAYGALGVAIFSVLLAVVSIVQMRKARKQLVLFRGTQEETDMLAAAADLALRNDELTAKVQKLSQTIAITQRDVAASLRHLAVVRFNAISEIGAQYSFSAAILDDHSNGIVLTCIQGRDQSRLYSKTVINGTSEMTLTPEELQAIASAKPEES
ncbi:MAG: hypothetical protein RL410_1082 [Actinomycetota bacterium]|jgi:hypothetical protein